MSWSSENNCQLLGETHRSPEVAKYQVLNRSYLGMPLIYLINVYARQFPRTAKVVQIVLFIINLFLFFSESSAVSQIPRILH